MVANWRANASLGLSAFLLTYLFSQVNNTWKTSLFRAILGFLLFYILAYLFRFFLHQIDAKKNKDLNHESSIGENGSTEAEQINLLKDDSMDESSFQFLPLHSLHNGAGTNNPEKVADTIRTWTTQNREE
ncbi:MAG TPA: hypothetical protein VGI04_02755 [Neobacillus sp.]